MDKPKFPTGNDQMEVEGKMYPSHLAHSEEGRIYYDSLHRDHTIEWHCPGRHGVIRNVNRKEDSGRVSRAITWFFGRKGQWWESTPNRPGYMDVEFVSTTKTIPPPREPWEWCGKTVLFENYQKIKMLNKQMSEMFSIGQKVSFVHKGEKIVGYITNKSKRATVLIPGNPLKWHVPFDMLEME